MSEDIEQEGALWLPDGTVAIIPEESRYYGTMRNYYGRGYVFAHEGQHYASVQSGLGDQAVAISATFYEAWLQEFPAPREPTLREVFWGVVEVVQVGYGWYLDTVRRWGNE